MKKVLNITLQSLLVMVFLFSGINALQAQDNELIRITSSKQFKGENPKNHTVIVTKGEIRFTETSNDKVLEYNPQPFAAIDYNAIKEFVLKEGFLEAMKKAPAVKYNTWYYTFKVETTNETMVFVIPGERNLKMDREVKEFWDVFYNSVDPYFSHRAGEI